ncbi:MAG TPA: ketopantoate reductase C-terminal domain-containing protein, partial [Candidatus Thermoplasmatota archaeon]|nr:ketopantoate reductase C-terminal domain-containing protein [Candidatus Thermoplasmatota archaeon]
RRVRQVLGKTPAYGSTWQSMERGRSLETEWLNGEVVRRGRALGVPTQVNARAVELAAKGARMSAAECGDALLSR